MEVIHDFGKARVKSVLFDFDGTISTLRCGWEEVMEPLMIEILMPLWQGEHDALRQTVKAYINESTGIQTIFQMKWLAEQVKARGMNPGAPEDPWWYKDEYNRRLAALSFPLMSYDQVAGYEEALSVSKKGIMGYIQYEKLDHIP